jgi:phage terminase large subunit-like protein
MTINSNIQDYIDLVKNGDFLCCKEQFLLIKHVENCFENENLYVDEKQLEDYLSLQKYFAYDLFPWEKFVFVLHNCTYSAPGVLRWPKLILILGRGSGKNGYLAFEDFALTTPVNGIKNYDIDIFATSEDQAKCSFMDIHSMLESNERKMKKYFRWNLTEITNLKTNSTIRYRTSNPKTKDGGRPGKIDFDEYHEYENYKLINVATTGLGKVPMPRMTIATTMGEVRDGPLDHLLEDMLAILNGIIPDNGQLPFICRLDKDSEINEEKYWHKANPSLRYFPYLLAELRSEYVNYKRDHLGNSAFKIKRMNRIGSGVEEPVAKWEDIKNTNREIPNLAGKPCVFGIDYTKTTDFMCAGLLFLVDDIYYWISHSWYCSESRDLSRLRIPIKDFEEKGLITRVEAPEIDPEIVKEWLSDKLKEYKVPGGGLDSYRYSILKKPLKELGYDCDKKGRNNLKMVRPSDIMQIAPTVTRLFANNKIVWGENPLMRWYTNNVCVKYDKKSNMFFEKIEPKSRKTDGFYAFLHALSQMEMLEKHSRGSYTNLPSVFTF